MEASGLGKIKRLSALILILVFMLIIAGCGGSSSSGDKKLTIAMVNPLSGDAATYGVSHKNGMELAREEINKAGGIKGRQVEILFHDDAGDPMQAAMGAQKFADQKDILAIVGSCLSTSTLAMVPITDKARVPHMVVSSSTPKLSGISPYFFRMSVQDDKVGGLMADLVKDKLKAKKVAFLYPDNDYGKGLLTALESRLKEHGIALVSSQAYLAADKDFSKLLAAVKTRNADVLVVGSTYTDGGLITKQARDRGLTIPIVGPTGLFSPKYVEIAGKAAEGTIFLGAFIVTNPDPAVQSFVEKYKVKFGMEPDTFAALGYDQMYVLAKAMEAAAAKGPITRENLKEALAKSNYTGITGTVTFDAKGDWVRPYLYITVKDGKFALYK